MLGFTFADTIFMFAITTIATLLFLILNKKVRKDATAVKIPTLLTPAELNFFNYIYSSFDSKKYVLCSKVRLGDIIKFTGGDDRQRWIRLQQVNRKHVDFVVCDRVSMMPIFAMELDDSSHNRKERRDRDTLVDSFLNQAYLPILHVKCQRTYRQSIREIIQLMSKGGVPQLDILDDARAGLRAIR